MIHKKLIKKICCMFLAFVLCVPFAFFYACSDNDPENKPCITITYKPYAGATDEENSTTYGEEIYEDAITLSGSILEALVDNYGQGSIGDGTENSLQREYNPSLNGVNIASFLGIVADEQQFFAQELNKMCYASYCTVEDKPCLVLSNNGGDATGLDDTKIIYESGSDKVYFYQGEKFVFVGGKVGSNNYTPTESGGVKNYTNTVNFITKLMNTNFNVIEKGFAGVDFGTSYTQNTPIDFTFSKWNYNLFSGNVSSFSTYSTAEDYIAAYKEQYALSFAVEVAKVKLCGADDLPNYEIAITENDVPDAFSINAGNYNLKTMYTSAQSGNDAAKQKFVELASVFIDHFGLTESEAEALYSAIKTQVIGTNNFNASENNLDYKNNYDTFIKFDGGENSALKSAQTANREEIILGFITKEDASAVENIDINGYINSILFYVVENVQMELEAFILQILNQNVTDFDFLFMVRSFDGSNFYKGYYPQASEELSESGFGIDLGDIVDKSTVSKFTADISSSSFNYNKTEFEKDVGVYYHGWYFTSNDNSPFIEFVFAKPNLTHLQHFDIEMVSLM